MMKKSSDLTSCQLTKTFGRGIISISELKTKTSARRKIGCIFSAPLAASKSVRLRRETGHRVGCARLVEISGASRDTEVGDY